MSIDSQIRSKLKMPTILEDIEEEEIQDSTPEVEQPESNSQPESTQIETSIRKVMTSYQNANRWLDTIKEALLMEYHLPCFSEIVHDLAHQMAEEFDRFGDILHTCNLRIPYPTTEEFTGQYVQLTEYVDEIIILLRSIQESLIEFKRVAEELPSTYTMSIMCDDLLMTLQKECNFYYKAHAQLTILDGHIIGWDHYIGCLWQNETGGIK